MEDINELKKSVKNLIDAVLRDKSESEKCYVEGLIDGMTFKEKNKSFEIKGQSKDDTA